MNESFAEKIIVLLKQEKKSLTLRDIANLVSLTERETELGVQFLLSKNLINPIDGIINHDSLVELTESGYVYVLQVNLTRAEMKETHLWKKSTPSFGTPGTAEAMMGTKMYPMGGWCVKCGLSSFQFKAKPIVCPKR